MLAFWMITACTGSQSSTALVELDGSSTVYPISEAIAEEYQHEQGGRVTIGVSGTGGGFKKFCRGEVHITGASRPIRPAEIEACEATGVEYIELPIAYDGIAVVIHPQNTWATTMTVGELKTLWQPEAQNTVTRWSQIRAGWPDEEVHLFGPGVDSGTYDYFTKAVVGREHASRGDITSSEDDNVLVQGVARDQHALGFFGLAYYEENTDKVNAVLIDRGDGARPVAPSTASVADGSYQPLSRPIFLYVSAQAAQDEDVASFVDFYLSERGRELAGEVGYVSLPADTQGLVRARFAARTTGTLFNSEGAMVAVRVAELLQASP